MQTFPKGQNSPPKKKWFYHHISPMTWPYFLAIAMGKTYVSGWWLGHPSEKFEFVNWDDYRNPIFLGKYQIHGHHSPPTSLCILLPPPSKQLCFLLEALIATSHPRGNQQGLDLASWRRAGDLATAGLF